MMCRITAARPSHFTYFPTRAICKYSCFLVPKLCLGTPFAKLCFASASHASEGDAKRSFADGVPKQSLGTRK